MNKTLFLLLFLVLLIIDGNAQTTITRQKSYGGSQNDNVQKIIRINDSYIVGGSSDSEISGDKTEPSRGFEDFWILNVDTGLNIIWQRTLGGSKSDILNDLILTHDSCLLLLGTSASDSSGEKSQNNYGDCDYWLIKMSLTGSILWQKIIGGEGYDEASVVYELPDGSILIGGSSQSDSSGLKTQNRRGIRDYWLLRLDMQGNILWNRTYGGNVIDMLHSITVLNDSMIIIAGRSNSPTSGEKSESSYGDYDIWLICVNLNGNIIWDRTLGGNQWDCPSAMVAKQHSLYVLGRSDSNVSGLKSQNSRGNEDFWIIKLDYSGNIKWDKTIGGSGWDVPYSMVYCEDNNLTISGASGSVISGEKLSPLYGVVDYWIIALDTNGNIFWQESIGGTLPDYGRNLVKLSSGGFVVAGDSYSGISGVKTTINHGMSDFWLIEFEVGTGISEYYTGKHIVKVYPNPAEDFLIIETDFDANISELYILDIHGKEVKSLIVNRPSIEVDIRDLTAGIYILKTRISDGYLEVNRFVKR